MVLAVPAAAVNENVGLEIAMPVPTSSDANVPPVTASVRVSPDTSPVTAPPDSDALLKVVPPL